MQNLCFFCVEVSNRHHLAYKCTYEATQKKAALCPLRHIIANNMMSRSSVVYGRFACTTPATPPSQKRETALSTFMYTM